MKKNILRLAIVFFILINATVIVQTSSVNLKNNSLPYEYYTYQQMTELFQDLETEHSDIMKLESYGKTYEGRDIWFVKISDNVELEEDEPGVLLLGTHHGDEKIAFELLIYFIKYVINNYETDTRVKNAVDSTQICLIPMINPDGAEANIRKNCNPDKEHGVNTNRNFGYDWQYYELFPDIFYDEWTSEPTSGNYRGPAPDSETETQAVKRVAESFTINISLSYHSGAEVVFYPWYHTTEKTPHENLFIEIGEEMGEISGYPLWTGTNPLIPKLGGTLGTSENYLYGEHTILAYTVEASRIKSPTNSNTVTEICEKNTEVHLYLCEKVQDIDNTKSTNSRLLSKSIPRIFDFMNILLSKFIKI